MANLRSFEGLQLNLFKLFEKQGANHADIFIQAEGREIPAHKAILAAHSEFLSGLFAENPGHERVELEHKFSVVYTLVRLLYFGGLAAERLTPLEGLDLLSLAEELQVKAVDAEDVRPIIVNGLDESNCVDVLNHEALHKFPEFEDAACKFTGEHLQPMLKNRKESLLKVPRHLLTVVLQYACHHVSSDAETDLVVKYCLNHTQIDSACDLLRETKTWQWGSGDFSVLGSLPAEDCSEEASQVWRIDGVRAAMDGTPAKVVAGKFFDWCIRLDYGAEGKLRLVYESAKPTEDKRAINRFPAAMFAWQVMYKGQNVFHEKPVFICFPENVPLHWSTTLPITAAELSDDDCLEITVMMAENPMISLVLYYFSADLKTTVFAEDILNRLPHIEYRCLSSYSLVKTHGAGAESPPN
ncbi:KBTBD4 [Symbiodinium pilosum]|uniref:KBTBD4 protein n=1 Tax=Symbiodinium pilosum TaxID=2952 RepID=A0A812UBW5_SYMPI|nr:KBTBD4 [Symbiodinium pilosum]